MELDDKIRDLIAGTPEAISSDINVNSPKTPNFNDSVPRKKVFFSFLEWPVNPEQRTGTIVKLKEAPFYSTGLLIRQEEKQQIPGSVLELKTKLAATEDICTLEKEQKQRVTEGDRQLEKEKESLREELEALQKENMLLKENNALTNRKKEHYACEIKRLNKLGDRTASSNALQHDGG
ncbi:TNFAIP3 interacting protein 3 [Cricetulus griseus]